MVGGRQKSSVFVAGIGATVAVLFAAGGSAVPLAAKQEIKPVEAVVPSCCVEFVSAASADFTSAPSATHLSLTSAQSPSVAASRWRVIDVPRLLPVGIAPEQGLQVKTILASRSISIAFPEIHSIGGVRPDGLRWHPNGLALDVMIPNPGSAEGIALGNEILAYALKNATRFGLQDAIWRGVYYTPNGPQSSGYGHFDHVHITTTGGGYPSGGEVYLR